VEPFREAFLWQDAAKKYAAPAGIPEKQQPDANLDRSVLFKVAAGLRDTKTK
jgi:hypothetical protein